MGPVGSGKSSGCCNEIMMRAHAQKPGPRGKRRSRWAVIRNCYDAQTEILTETRGWQLFKDLDPEDKVAMLENGAMVFAKPTYYYRAPHDGEMVGIRSQNVDLFVTPNHKLWVSGRRTRKKVWCRHEFKKAEEIYGSGEVWRMSSESKGWQGGSTQFSEDFLEFLGFWFAEGYAGVYQRAVSGGQHYRLVVSQKKYCPYVQELLKRCGLPYGRHDKGGGNFNYTLSTAEPETKELIHKLADCGKSTTKKVPTWIKNAPITHLRAFLRGHQMGDGRFKTGPHSCDQHVTASVDLANDLQEMLAKTGKASTVTYSGGRYEVTVSTKERSNPVIQKRHWRKEKYTGYVYCVEVPTHIVYVRRNGKAVWCSQTYGELKDTTIRTWLDWFPEDVYGKFHWTDYEHYLEFNDIELEVWFRALDRPDHVAKVLSMEVTGAWINEAREVPYSIVKAVGDRVGRYPSRREEGCSWRGVIQDTNPPDTDHWWAVLANKDRSTDFGRDLLSSVEQSEALMREQGQTAPMFEFFSQPGGLIETGLDGEGRPIFVPNPRAENLNNLEPGYYISRMAGATASHIRVYYCGNYGFSFDGKPILPEYRDQTHCAKEQLKPVRGIPIQWGADFGLTPAIVFGQRFPNGRITWVDELVATDMGSENFAKLFVQYVNATFAGHRFADGTGDPAGEQRAQTDEATPFQIFNQVLEQSRMPIRLYPARTNDFTIRREAIAHPLGRLIDGAPGLLVSPKCAVTRKGLQGGYCYKRMKVSGDEKYHDKPDKNKFSHPVEAGGYMNLGMGEGVSLIIPDINEEEEEGTRKPWGTGRSAVSGY